MSTFCLLQIANVRDRDWFTWTYFVFPKTISGYDKPSEMRNIVNQLRQVVSR